MAKHNKPKTTVEAPKKTARRPRKVNVKIPDFINEKQNQFLDIALKQKTELMFCTGPAGTSKTFLAILASLQLLNMGAINKILYVRSVVESSDSKLGFLPGEEGMKMEPYLRPLRDKLGELLTPTDVSYMFQNDMIDAEHVGYARGQNWNDMAIVVDEAQNLTEKEILTIVTRCGRGSKVFLLGDPQQSDIKGKSGLVKFTNMFTGEEARDHGIETFEFTADDIVRSNLVKFILQTYEANDTSDADFRPLDFKTRNRKVVNQ
jgi:phosphate starvation-inducible PhoH-like protein